MALKIMHKIRHILMAVKTSLLYLENEIIYF